MVRCSRAKFQGLEVNFGHQRAGGDQSLSARRDLASSRTVGGTPGWALKTSTAPCGTSSMASTKIAPRRRKLLDYVGVMDDLVVHVDRRAIGFQRQLDDIHRAHHTRAKTRGLTLSNTFPFVAVGIVILMS